ncbi:hypothetical protein G9U52_26195 [Paenibacillus sp. S3N08]|uniref:Uncharacterized protein n=2 Tax=Paenibacillus agricola TaxID=2716264 RepID=A0ABX0JA21_9BACL|nr:hypothetical protein [Paenibacillus agricola]
MTIVIVMGVIGLALIFLGVLKMKTESAYIKETRKQYINVLQQLAKAPDNDQLKELAYSYGRKYYVSLRKDGNLTVNDERAISNDLVYHICPQ